LCVILQRRGRDKCVAVAGGRVTVDYAAVDDDLPFFM
jgi:hypothetical protein